MLRAKLPLSGAVSGEVGRPGAQRAWSWQWLSQWYPTRGWLAISTGELGSDHPVESEWINFFEIRPSTFFHCERCFRCISFLFPLCFEPKVRFQTFDTFPPPFWCFSYWHRFAWATSWSSQSPGSNLTQMMISIRPRPRFSILRRRYGGGTWTTHGSTSIIAAIKMGKSLTKSIDVKGSSVEILKLVTPSENGWFQFYSTKNTHDMYICCFVLKINQRWINAAKSSFPWLFFCLLRAAHSFLTQEEEQHPAMKAIARQQRAPGLVPGLPKCLGGWHWFPWPCGLFYWGKMKNARRVRWFWQGKRYFNELCSKYIHNDIVIVYSIYIVVSE